MGKWHVNGWSLRTKVAVVLALPAIVALVLGGARVKTQLDEASRLSTVRDQVGVLRDSITLSDLVTAEMQAAIVPNNPDLDARKAAVDKLATSVRQAGVFTRLPADVTRTLNDSLGRLSGLRQQSAGGSTDPITEIAGYLEVINSVGDVVPGIVTVARTEDLDKGARAVTSLLRLRAILATEELLVRFGGAAGPVNPAIAAAAQRLAAEENLLSSQAQRDMPAAYITPFATATNSAQARRDALQLAVSGTGAVQPATLLPQLAAESSAIDALRGDLINSLSDNVSTQTNEARSDALRDAAIVLGALLAALAIALIVARSLLAPVRTLRSAALSAAHTQLPDTVERVRAGERVDWRSIEPVPVHTGEEIGQLARAFDDMHQQAVRLAGEQAELRRQIGEMFTTLSRRSQSLVELQLETIESLESDEQDPRRLEGLFRLDHLATRLRRNGENLQVLAGGTPARRGQGPVTVVELLRAATSEVADYRRVSLGHAPNGSVRGNAAADIVHILAELLENATRFSPPERKVVLTADRGADGGLLIEVVDGGLGMAPDDMAAANRRLAAADDVGPETTRRMGLYVVSRLSERHGVTVRLRPTYDTAKQKGVTASVHVPAGLVVADGTPDTPPRVPAVQAMQAIPAVPVAPVLPAAPAMPAAPALPAARDIHAVREIAPAPAPRAPIHEPVAEAPTRNWFVAETEVDTPAPEPAATAPVVGPASKWTAPSDNLWRAANNAMSQQVSLTTAAGLPMRKPGARTLPTGPDNERTISGIAFRDPESIRSNLSRHYNGVRAARQRTQTEPDAREEQ
jgi:signal transduction histidine kinase